MREKKLESIDYGKILRSFFLYGIPFYIAFSVAFCGGSEDRKGLEFSSRIREKKLKDQGGVCGDCKKKSSEYQGHHIVPIEFGGSKHYDNLVMLCPSCHRKWDNLARYNRKIYHNAYPEGIPLDSAPQHLFAECD